MNNNNNNNNNNNIYIYFLNFFMQTTFIQIFVIAIFNFKRKFKKVHAVRPPHSDFPKS